MRLNRDSRIVKKLVAVPFFHDGFHARYLSCSWSLRPLTSSAVLPKIGPVNKV